jgi:putative ABC transport system substrate-binding protein
MNRRDLLVLLGGAITAGPRVTRAQQKAMAVIGYLASSSAGPSAPNVDAIRQGLSETGYVEGQNVTIEFRWAEGSYDRLPALAADLASRKVDLIVTTGGSLAALAAKDATSTIPIVFETVDPEGAALVASLARPGGNLTGVSTFAMDLQTKRLELLSELVPQARVIALLVNPTATASERIIREVQEAALAKGIQVHLVVANVDDELETAFATLVKSKAGALIVSSDPFFSNRREHLAGLATRHAVPAIYQGREFVVSGGLISYGPNLRDVDRKLGIYTGRILKGEKPADLPVQQPPKSELIINLKTAKALGLTVPQSLLARAAEVIK